MSRIKYSNNLFLGRFELQRTKEFFDDDGFRKFILNNAIEFGLINNSTDGNFTNGKVSKDINDNTIKYDAIEAIDNLGNFIVKSATTNISVPTNGNWYWVKVKFAESNLEQGTVTISADGTITGVGTEFLKTLRGVRTDFPARISFPNSVNNTGQYDVLEIISDTSAILQGITEPVRTFTAESNLTYQIVGTFTPGSVPDSADENIFIYDSALITLVQETALNTPPTLIDGQEFLLARVRSVGTDVEIQDKRNSIFKTTSNYFVKNLDKAANPLIGVESVKWDSTLSTRDKNIIEVAWGMRSSNWTIDSSLNRVTIIGGQGGKFKSTGDFTTGDFDGWRIYTKDGSYSIIKQSTLSATQINLTLDVLDPDKYSDTAQQLLIVPDVSEVSIIIKANSGDGTTLPNNKFTYPVNTDVAKIHALVYKSPSCNYVVQYQYKHIKDYSAILTIPSDSESGYLTEASFNSDGSLKPIEDQVRNTYTSSATVGFITTVLASNAYSNRIASIETGDLFGFEDHDLDNANPVISLEVGTNPLNQRINPTTITLTTEHYINLKTTNAGAGNKFWIEIQANITLNGETYKVVQDYVNSGDPGTELLDINQFLIEQAGDQNLLLKCTFDGTNWEVFPHVSLVEVAATPPRHRASFDLDLALTTSYQTVATAIDTENTSSRFFLLRLSGVTSGNDDNDLMNIRFEGSSDNSSWNLVSTTIMHRSLSNNDVLFSIAYGPILNSYRYVRARVQGLTGGGGLGMILRNVTFEYNLLD